MKKFIHILYAIIALCLTLSCTQSKIKNDEKLLYVVWDSLKNADFLVEPYTSLEFVKLETNDNCIINDIAKIELDDSLIFIEDYMQRLYSFHRNGKFLCRIGEKGGADNEYVTMFDFVLNRKEKQVYIVDSSSGKIVIYDYCGKYLGNKRFDSAALSHSVKTAFVDDECLATINFNSPDERYNFSIFDIESSRVKNCVEYLSTGNIRYHNEEGRTTLLSSNLLLCAELSDTIYVCANREICPMYVFQGFAKHATQDDIKQDKYDFGAQAASQLLNDGFSAGIDNLYATNKVLHFQCQSKDGFYRIFYDTETKEGYKYDITKDLDSDNSLLWNYLKASCSDAFVCSLPVCYFLSNTHTRKTYPKLDELLDKSKDEDNPILAFFIAS